MECPETIQAWGDWTQFAAPMHRYRRHRLAWVCDLFSRVPSNVMPMTAEEANLVCELTLQSFDSLLHSLHTKSGQELAPFVADPDAWVQNRKRTALLMRDAVPVYLDCSTGKILVPMERLSAERQKIMRSSLPGKRSLTLDYTSPNEAQGATRKDKNRLTWICRQAIHGLFDCTPGSLPEGKILPSVLLVPGSQPARLEDMSLQEPSVWLRTHNVIVDCKLIERVEGAKVGQLARGWRDLRRERPGFFSGEVLIWFQREVTMDEVRGWVGG